MLQIYVFGIRCNGGGIGDGETNFLPPTVYLFVFFGCHSHKQLPFLA